MWNRKMKISGILVTVFAVGQIILAVVLYNPEANVTVINLGWGVLMLSAIFGWLPILTFRKKGEVEGKSYINTTVLVDTGVYSIVRHPQYLAGVLISIALPLITQHWLVAILGAAAVVLYVLGTYDEEEGCIDKFGDVYIDYMKRVPRMNFLLGIFRLISGKN